MTSDDLITIWLPEVWWSKISIKELNQIYIQIVKLADNLGILNSFSAHTVIC